MTDEGALQGAVEGRGIVRRLAKRSELRVAALVRTEDDRRRIVYQRMNDSLPGLALPIAHTEIPLTADFQTAAAERQTLFAKRRDSLGALAYRRLALELGVPGRTDGPRRAARCGHDRASPPAARHRRSARRRARSTTRRPGTSARSARQSRARAAFELGAHKRELIGALTRAHVNPHSEDGLAGLRELLAAGHPHDERGTPPNREQAE